MIDVLRVGLAFSPDADVDVGRLAMDGNAAVLEYDPAFARSGLALGPLSRPRPAQLVRANEPRLFSGLHGVFADSLPDAWGRMLVDRRIAALGGSVLATTALDRLSIVGRRGRGALTYVPATGDVEPPHLVELARLAHDVDELLEGDAGDVVRELVELAGSSGGARPKVHVALDDAGRARTDDGGALPPGFSHWIVKFRGSVDRFADIGPVEAAYADAARDAGVDVPQTRLIETRGPGWFATRRFDRRPDGSRRHVLSVAGMLEIDRTTPAIDYGTLHDLVRAATRDEAAVLEMFRRMVFNVASVNGDDHAKQHGFLMTADGRWTLAPAYDLTPSSGPGGERYLAVAGLGRDITREALLEVARAQSITAKRACAVIDRVADAVATIPPVARGYGAARATVASIERAIAAQRKLL